MTTFLVAVKLERSGKVTFNSFHGVPKIRLFDVHNDGQSGSFRYCDEEYSAKTRFVFYPQN